MPFPNAPDPNAPDITTPYPFLPRPIPPDPSVIAPDGAKISVPYTGTPLDQVHLAASLDHYMSTNYPGSNALNSNFNSNSLSGLDLAQNPVAASAFAAPPPVTPAPVPSAPVLPAPYMPGSRPPASPLMTSLVQNAASAQRTVPVPAQRTGPPQAQNIAPPQAQNIAPPQSMPPTVSRPGSNLNFAPTRPKTTMTTIMPPAQTAPSSLNPSSLKPAGAGVLSPSAPAPGKTQAAAQNANSQSMLRQNANSQSANSTGEYSPQAQAQAVAALDKKPDYPGFNYDTAPAVKPAYATPLAERNKSILHYNNLLRQRKATAQDWINQNIHVQHADAQLEGTGYFGSDQGTAVRADDIKSGVYKPIPTTLDNFVQGAQQFGQQTLQNLKDYATITGGTPDNPAAKLPPMPGDPTQAQRAAAVDRIAFQANPVNIAHGLLNDPLVKPMLTADRALLPYAAPLLGPALSPLAMTAAQRYALPLGTGLTTAGSQLQSGIHTQPFQVFMDALPSALDGAGSLLGHVGAGVGEVGGAVDALHAPDPELRQVPGAPSPALSPAIPSPVRADPSTTVADPPATVADPSATVADPSTTLATALLTPPQRVAMGMHPGPSTGMHPAPGGATPAAPAPSMRDTPLSFSEALRQTTPDPAATPPGADPLSTYDLASSLFDSPQARTQMGLQPPPEVQDPLAASTRPRMQAGEPGNTFNPELGSKESVYYPTYGAHSSLVFVSSELMQRLAAFAGETDPLRLNPEGVAPNAKFVEDAGAQGIVSPETLEHLRQGIKDNHGFGVIVLNAGKKHTDAVWDGIIVHEKQHLLQHEYALEPEDEANLITEIKKNNRLKRAWSRLQWSTDTLYYKYPLQELPSRLASGEYRELLESGDGAPIMTDDDAEQMFVLYADAVRQRHGGEAAAEIYNAAPHLRDLMRARKNIPNTPQYQYLVDFTGKDQPVFSDTPHPTFQNDPVDLDQLFSNQDKPPPQNSVRQ